MKISLVVVGKTQSKEAAAMIADFSKRISHYASFEVIETSEEKLATALDRYDRVFLLDDKGKEHASADFAAFIGKQMNAGLQSVAFAVGGPFGFAPDVRALADAEISLSRMTFPHDLVRVIFLEQLYRAFTILRNEKYHHA
jgi:23S rRNA (pseudouridine1915-N3)-methyltransferase